MPLNVDYSVTVPVPVDEAFRGFQYLDRLLNRGIYECANWTEGAPWQVGSRVRYVLVKPVRATISCVLTAMSPPRSVDFIGHAVGVTAQQHVSFGPDLHGGTRIRMTMSFIGKSTELSDAELEKAAVFVTRDALDTIVAFCQKQSTGSAPKE